MVNQKFEKLINIVNLYETEHNEILWKFQIPKLKIARRNKAIQNL